MPRKRQSKPPPTTVEIVRMIDRRDVSFEIRARWPGAEGVSTEWCTGVLDLLQRIESLLSEGA